MSYDDPALDITQLGDEGTVTDLAVITVYGGDYETLWEAGSTNEGFGGSLDLSLDGSTIVGSGSLPHVRGVSDGAVQSGAAVRGKDVAPRSARRRGLGGEGERG